MFPLGRTGLHGEPEGTFEKTKQTVRLFWRNEMQKAEQLVDARVRHGKNEASESDLMLLYYPQRPSLEQVLIALKQHSQTIL